MNAPLRVLIIEDSEDDALLILRELGYGRRPLTHHRVDTASTMRNALEQNVWDLVIADYNLPQFSAPEALQVLQEKGLDLPFIIVSGALGEDLAVAAMRAGAHDYLMKGNLLRLLPAVERELREAQERQRRRQAEQDLRRSEAYSRLLLENALDAIIVLNPEGSILYSSSSAQQVLGYQPETLIHHSFYQYIHYEDQPAVAEAFAAAIAHQEMPQVVEFRFQSSEGHWRTLEAISKYFLDSVGQTNLVVNARDITERKQAEEIRQELQKERELRELKARFFSMMSHELKNPLGAIAAATELLEHYAHKTDAAKRSQHFQMIRDAVQEIMQILNDTLVLGKADAGKLEFQPTLLDLEGFCSQLVEEIQFSIGHEHSIELTYCGQNSCVFLDPELLRHILGNLLSNAVKYSPPGKTIQFEVTCKPFPGTYSERQDMHGVVMFKVQDSGIGIPQDDQEQLFDSFHRAKNVGQIPGTGLGLTIAKQCVELHGGSISLESQVNVGTTCTVTLPFFYP